MTSCWILLDAGGSIDFSFQAWDGPAWPISPAGSSKASAQENRKDVDATTRDFNHFGLQNLQSDQSELTTCEMWIFFYFTCYSFFFLLSFFLSVFLSFSVPSFLVFVFHCLLLFCLFSCLSVFSRSLPSFCFLPSFPVFRTIQPRRNVTFYNFSQPHWDLACTHGQWRMFASNWAHCCPKAGTLGYFTSMPMSKLWITHS